MGTTRRPAPLRSPGTFAVLVAALLLAACRTRAPQPASPPPPAPPAASAPTADPSVDRTRRTEEAMETVPIDTLMPASFAPAGPRAPGAEPPRLAAEPGARPRSAMARRHELVYVVDGIGAEPGGAPLDDGSRAILDQLADRLRLGDADFRLEVQGFGGAGWSAAARAEVVRRYLVEVAGIPPERTAVVPIAAAEPRVAVLVLR